MYPCNTYLKISEIVPQGQWVAVVLHFFNIMLVFPFILHRNGYFVIGRPNRNFTADLLISTYGQLIPDNTGAIALYHDDSRNYEIAMYPTNTRLQDAVVFGTENAQSAQLINVLIPGQKQVIEDQAFLDGEESIVRCNCCQALNMSVYKQSSPTPGRRNPCIQRPPTTAPTTLPPLTPPSSHEVYISEIAIETHYFTREWIELEGRNGLSLDNYFIVLYNIDGLAAYTIQLENKIGPDGYFLIGESLMVPPPDLSLPMNLFGSYILERGGAVALYYGFVTDIPEGEDATDKNLVDAVVFTGSLETPVAGQVDVLTDGSEQFFANLERYDLYDILTY